MPEVTRFESYEAMLEAFRERADDLQVVRIPVPGVVNVSQPGGSIPCPDVGGIVEWAGGGKTLIDREMMERLLNDGLPTRLRAPIRLEVPTKTR